MFNKFVTSFVLSFCALPSFAFTGANEFVLRQRGGSLVHIIDYYKVLVVLNIKEEQFSNRQVQCGVFPLNENTRVGQFGENVVDFSRKEYALLNGKEYFYVDDKIHVSLYRNICNNFIPSSSNKPAPTASKK